MEEQTGRVCETEPSEPPTERRQLAPRTDSSTTMLALMEQLALDPDADVAKLERVIALYERLTAKAAELAYNAAKGRILKKLADINTARCSRKSTTGNRKTAPTEPSNTRRSRRSTNICARFWRKRRWTSPIRTNPARAA